MRNMKNRKAIQFREDRSEQIDIRKLLSISLRHWYLFILAILFCLGIAYLYLRYTTPYYNINSSILIKDDKKGPDLKGAAVFSELDFFKSTNNIDNEIEILRSLGLMQRALNELSLQTSYYVEGRFRNREIYGEKLPVKVIISDLDSSAYKKFINIQITDKNHFQLKETDANDSLKTNIYQFGQKIQKPYGSFTIVKGPNLNAFSRSSDREIIIQFHNIRKLANYYSSMLTVWPVSKTASVVTLNLSDPVPQKGKDILNKLVELYDRESIEDKNYIASSTIAFLDERLRFITEELTNVEKDVENYKRQKEITNVNLQAQYYVDNASDYRRQLTEWSIQIDVLESIEAYIQQQGDNYELVPSSLSVQNPTLLGLITKFNEMQLERERILRTTLPSNPIVQNIDVQLTNLRTNILANLRNIKNSLIITRDSHQASSGQFTSKIQEVPSIERHLLEINRQQGIKQNLYLYLLQKREESALALAATVSNIRIIDHAIGGDAPASPNKTIVILLAVIFGISLPMAFLYIRDSMNDKVRERKDVERMTRTPILGEISHNTTKNTVVVTEKSRTPVSELFRLIRMNLSFSTVGKQNKVIMITSSMSGEGKTFFSINLAASMALTGKKVVIVDLDLRKPKLLENLGLSNDVGVTDYIMSPAVTLDEIVKPVQIESLLFVVGTGPLPPNPAEFMMNAELGKLINELKENFDQIIIDTAPVGQVADAFVLSPLIDSTIYIVRHNYTFKDHLEIVDEIYAENKLKNLMIVLNDAKKEKGYRYGYGYGYGKVSKKIIDSKEKYTV